MTLAQATRGPAHHAAPSRARGVAWNALLVTIVVVPLATSVYPMRLTGQAWTADLYDTPKLFALRIGLLVCAGAWAWSAAVDLGRWRYAKPLVWFLPLLAWAAVSAAFGVAPLTSFFGQYGRNEGVLTWLFYALAAFLTVQLADSAKRVRALAAATVGVSTLLSCYGLLQFIGIEPLLTRQFGYAGRAFATAGNPEQLGNLLVIGAPLAVAMALGESVRYRRALLWAAAVLVLVGLVATFTRGAWIAAAVSLILLGVLARRQRVPIDRVVDGGAALGALAAMLALFISSASSSDAVTNIATRLASLLDVGAGSIQTRVELWRIAAAATADRPLLGFGTDAYAHLMPAYRTAGYFENTGATTLADSAHSIWLQMASTMGLVGVALFAVLVSSILWSSGRSVWSGQHAGGRVILAGFWSGAVGYLLAVSVGTTDGGTAFLFWIACGAVLAPIAVERRLAARLARKGAAVTAAAVAGLLAVMATSALVADARFLQVAVAEGRQSLDAADDAIALAPYMSPYQTTRAQLLLTALTSGIEAAIENGSAVEPGMSQEFDRVVGVLEELGRRSPWDYRVQVALAHYYNRAGAQLEESYYRKSLEVTDRALERFPVSPEIHLKRAETFIGLDDVAQARLELERALAIDPDYADAQALRDRLSEGGG